MKYKEKNIKIKVIQFENGDMLIAVSCGSYFIKTSDGIMIYNIEEMQEIYNFNGIYNFNDK
jgi:hypothetical protein